jgi:hypothetical protein
MLTYVRQKLIGVTKRPNELYAQLHLSIYQNTCSEWGLFIQMCYRTSNKYEAELDMDGFYYLTYISF